MVVRRNPRQFAAESFRFFVHGHVRLATMRMLQDTDPRLPQAEQVFAGFFQNLDRQDGWSGRKVENPFRHPNSSQAT